MDLIPERAIVRGRDVHMPPDLPDPCFAVPFCPICRGGRMRVTYRTSRLAVCICMECETSLSVPDSAWGRAAVENADPSPGTGET